MTMAATLTTPRANRRLTPNTSELPVPMAGAAPGKRVSSLAVMGRSRFMIVADQAFQTVPATKPAPWRPMMLAREWGEPSATVRFRRLRSRCQIGGGGGGSSCS